MAGGARSARVTVESPPVAGSALSNLDVRNGRRQALVVVLAQVLLGAIVAVGCLAVSDARAGVSALVGAGIGIVATSLMAFAMLRHGASANAQRVAWSFFSGWMVKVVFTIAMLVLALRSSRIDAMPLLAGYAVTYVGYWFGAARVGATKVDENLGVSD